MKKLFLLLVSTFFSFSIFAAEKTPEWYKKLKSVYPQNKYLSAIGCGQTEEAAMTDAVNQIARTIKATVSSDLHTSSREQSVNGQSDSVVFFVENTNINSNVELRGLNFTDPYYVKKNKLYYCAAYIDRSYAWEQLKPEIDMTALEVKTIYETVKDLAPLEAFMRLNEVSRVWKKLSQQLEFGRAIYSGIDSVYEEEKKIASSLKAEKATRLSDFSVNLQISSDSNDVIRNAIVSGLKFNGIQCGSSSRYVYQGFAEIKDNVEIEEDIVTMTPSIDFSFVDESGNTVFRFSRTLDSRKSAYNEEMAKKRSYKALADEIKSKLPEEVYNNFIIY